jgi:nitrile hydratase
VNGPHDLGGQHGFGPVAPDPEEKLFHGEWERRAFALVLAMGATGAWNIDMSRHARERIPPADYLRSPYYAIWLKGMERLLLEKGLVRAEELRTGRALEGPLALPRRPDADAVPAILAKGAPTEREPVAPARFAVGDNVRARVMNPAGHTRLPRYLRGRTGRIERVFGAHVFPDRHAHGGVRTLNGSIRSALTPPKSGARMAATATRSWPICGSPILSGPELSGMLPAHFPIPRDKGGAVFPTPWAARAFALAVLLQDRGVFSPSEWADALGAELRREANGNADEPRSYWAAWLTALEELLRRKEVARSGDLATLQEAWRRAAEATPHGEPVEFPPKLRPEASRRKARPERSDEQLRR